eukprot:6490432-Amphidinium_carterae.2
MKGFTVEGVSGATRKSYAKRAQTNESSDLPHALGRNRQAKVYLLCLAEKNAKPVFFCESALRMQVKKTVSRHTLSLWVWNHLRMCYL